MVGQTALSAYRRRHDGHGAGAVLIASGSVLNVGLAAIASVIVARQLGVVGRGDWAVISALGALVGTLATLGLPSAAGFAAARTTGDQRNRIVQASLLASCGLAALAGCAYVAASFATTPASTGRAVVLSGALISISLIVLQVVGQIVLTSVSLRWFALAQALPAAIVLAGVVLVGSRLSIASLILLSSGANFAGTLLCVGAIFRHGVAGRRLLVSGVHGVVGPLRPYLAFALLTVGTIGLTHIVQRIDILLVQGFRGSAVAGLYAVSVQVADLLLVIPSALGFLVFRLGSASLAGHWTQALRAIRWTAGTSIGAAALLGLGAPSILERVFGAEYAGGSSALRWLLPGAVLLGIQAVISNYVASRGRPRVVLLAWLTAASLNVGLNLLVIPAYGIAGAAAVSSLSYLVVVLLHLRALLALRPEPGVQNP